jgi:hypothetical protein
MTKKLYVLVSNGGDGSYSPQFTLDPDLVARLEKAYEEGFMDCGNGIGCDGDGFHYETINVPDNSTPESLGILMLDDNHADEFFNN